jgi:hypothetical protein
VAQGLSGAAAAHVVVPIGVEGDLRNERIVGDHLQPVREMYSQV